MKPFLAVTSRFLIVMLVGLAPFLVLAAVVGWHDIIKIAIYGLFVTLLATVPNGVRTGITFALVFTVFATAGAMVQGSVLGTTVVVGLSAAMIPFFGSQGHLQAGIFAAMFVANAFNPAPQPWSGATTHSLSFLAAVAGVTLLGALWGLLIGKIIRRVLPELPAGPVIPSRAAVVGGVIVVAVAAIVAYYSVTHFPQAKWAWLLATIYSMMMAATGLTWKTSWQLIAGTTAGVLGAVLILFLIPPISLMMLLGAVAMSASIGLRVVGKPYWLATGVSTAGVIFLTGSSMDPFVAAEDRLFFTAIGAIIAVLLGAAITLAVRWQEALIKRRHEVSA